MCLINNSLCVQTEKSGEAIIGSTTVLYIRKNMGGNKS